MILDTEFLISLRADDDGALELAADLETTGVPTIVLQELYVGVGAEGQNIHAYEALVANTPAVPLDTAIARRAGILEGEHLLSNTKPDLGPSDAIVAATALVHEKPVVTNDGDFDHVDGLAVESY